MNVMSSKRLALSILACCSSASLVCGIGKSQTNAEELPVTVADCIRMTEFVAPDYNVGRVAGHQAAQFSPDGKRFVILVKSGDLENNANKYSLLLFKTENALESPAAEVLVSFSSTSNRPGIQQTRWIDSRTITFLAENPGEVQQLYTINCDTRRLTKLTDHATSLVSYALSSSGDSVFFLASRSVESLLNRQVFKQGLLVSNQNLYDLMTGERRFHIERFSDLFVKRKGEPEEIPIRATDRIASSSISLAPNGRYLLLKTYVDHISELWKSYREDWLMLATRTQPVQGEIPTIVRYQLLDVVTGQMHDLMDAPVHPAHSEVAWAADSSSIVMSDIQLPLGGVSSVEREARESDTFVAEIKIPSGKVVPITSNPLKLMRWDAQTKKVLLEPAELPAKGKARDDMVAFARNAGRWEKVATDGSGRGDGDSLEVDLDEDMNTPPRFFSRNTGTGQKVLLLDLNPRFKNLEFARVEDITFRATDGHMVKAGLYRPPGFAKGKKYPLVIQTHAWNPDKFLIDGPWPSGFAAQPLASHGMVVLQLEEDFSKISTPAEALEEMAAYEGGIEFLDDLGFIDRERVGIIGFSRTGFGVKYTLTHSQHHFAAATVADGSDGGYFTYLAFLTSIPINIADMEGVNGGDPLGDHLLSWLRSSPGFNLDKVVTPVREEAYEPLSLLVAWEWFAGLSRLRKPVELIYLPDASHVLTKPWERMTSQQGNVDWFCFWLKDEEDPDSSKKEQYQRWRHLRDLKTVTTEPAFRHDTR